MIAAAASCQPSAFSAAGRLPTVARIFSAGRGWPMTPVEAASTSWRLQPRPAAPASTTRRTEVAPDLPVKALALAEPGRASCSERGFPYVLLWVGCLDLKKKTT